MDEVRKNLVNKPENLMESGVILPKPDTWKFALIQLRLVLNDHIDRRCSIVMHKLHQLVHHSFSESSLDASLLWLVVAFNEEIYWVFNYRWVIPN